MTIQPEKIQRIPIPKPKRDAVWKRDHKTVIAICPCCNTNQMEINTCVCAHKTAVANHGSDDMDNLISICSQCNSAMGTMGYDEYINKNYPSKEMQEIQMKIEENNNHISLFKTSIDRLEIQNKELEKEYALVSKVSKSSSINLEEQNELKLEYNPKIHCRKCNVELTSDNTTPSSFKYNWRICRICDKKQTEVLKTKKSELVLEVPLSTTDIETTKKIYYLKSSRGADAIGEENKEGFLVYKGSKITPTETESTSLGRRNLRKKLIEEKIIDNLIFTQDYLFTSHSAASSVVKGMSSNGLVDWKIKKMNNF